MKKIGILAIAIFATALSSENLYPGINTQVVPLNERNWDNQITKGRSNNNVFVIHFYSRSDSKSYALSEQLDEQANKLKGIVKFAAVNCDNHKELCVKEGAVDSPTVKIYPPIPIPPFVPDAGLDVKKIAAWASGYVPSSIVEVNDDNYNGLVNSNPSVPKAVLFTNKDSDPLLWKAISNAFKEKILIGITRSTQKDVCHKFGVSKFPTIAIHKTGEKRPIVYTGKFGYQDIFDFLNIYSEQFVPGGGNAADGPGDKPWLNEAVPELHGKSSDDVCFAHQKTLCVMLVHQGKPENSLIDTLKDVRREYENKLDRSVSFKFMWIDSQTQKEFTGAFKASSPSIIILNHGRRKRYLHVEGKPTYTSITSQLEKILGGDARLSPLRTELPKLNDA